MHQVLLRMSARVCEQYLCLCVTSMWVDGYLCLCACELLSLIRARAVSLALSLCIYVYIYIFVCIYIPLRTCMNALKIENMLQKTHTHTHTYTHIHTVLCTRMQYKTTWTRNPHPIRTYTLNTHTHSLSLTLTLSLSHTHTFVHECRFFQRAISADSALLPLPRDVGRTQMTVKSDKVMDNLDSVISQINGISYVACGGGGGGGIMLWRRL